MLELAKQLLLNVKGGIKTTIAGVVVFIASFVVIYTEVATWAVAGPMLIVGVFLFIAPDVRKKKNP